jgi:hypothetical protein
MVAALGEAHRRLVETLRAIGEPGADTRLRKAVAHLAGLGIGLTPSGDDILAGVLLALRAAHHDDCEALSRTIYETAAPHTSHLSRAFLKVASQGLADARWHRLLNALNGAPDTDLGRAVDEVAGFGATSGLDMLNGFIGGTQALRRWT